MTEATLRKRPKHLAIWQIRFPITAIISILHRISGAGLFFLLPFLLYLLNGSLSGMDSFAKVQEIIAHPLAKLVLLGVLWAYLHHFCAGIRFLLLDIGKGVELPCARQSSWVVLAVSLTLTAIIGGKLLW